MIPTISPGPRFRNLPIPTPPFAAQIHDAGYDVTQLSRHVVLDQRVSHGGYEVRVRQQHEAQERSVPARRVGSGQSSFTELDDSVRNIVGDVFDIQTNAKLTMCDEIHDVVLARFHAPLVSQYPRVVEELVVVRENGKGTIFIWHFYVQPRRVDPLQQALDRFWVVVRQFDRQRFRFCHTAVETGFEEWGSSAKYFFVGHEDLLFRAGNDGNHCRGEESVRN
ncbi:MAG: hypothetical protein Q9227_001358 [Pyrenula ochraceoflavens]